MINTKYAPAEQYYLFPSSYFSTVTQYLHHIIVPHNLNMAEPRRPQTRDNSFNLSAVLSSSIIIW